MTAVRVVGAGELVGLRPALRALLLDSVAHGASIGFLDPFGPADADAYWDGVDAAVRSGGRVLLVAADAHGSVVGTAQLDVDTSPNQAHRATVSKVLVHSAARGRGIGAALMAALDRAAADAGRWLLTLDTATAAAERLYARTGWARAGAIPDYARDPDGTLTPTVLYYKSLR